MRIPVVSSLALATLATLATPARADGPPGACECAVPAAPEPPRATHWYTDKIGVGLHVTAMSVHDERTPDAEPQPYGGGGLHLTYRFGARWELEASTERFENEETGDTLEGGSIGARYHLTPYRRWDFYLLAGLGGVSDQDERELGMVHAGVGVERRFGRIGLAGEWRIAGLQPSEQDGTRASSTSMPVPDEMSEEEPGLSAGQLRLAVSYHF